MSGYSRTDKDIGKNNGDRKSGHWIISMITQNFDDKTIHLTKTSWIVSSKKSIFLIVNMSFIRIQNITDYVLKAHPP